MNALAFDLGASGGKVVSGNFDGDRLRILRKFIVFRIIQ